MTIRSSRVRRSTAVLALAAAMTVAPRSSAGEPTQADIESARALYVEGMELRDKGDLTKSLQQFRAAHALAATPITSLELARALALTGQLLEAREAALSVERLPVRPEESSKAANARVDARAYAELLKGRIPGLRIEVQRAPSGDAPRVSVDGVAIPPEALGTARKLNPGKHSVVAEQGSMRAASDVVLGEYETRDLKLHLTSSGSTGAFGPVPPRGEESTSPWLWVGLGTTGVGTLVGTITGIVALSTAHHVEGQCIGAHCPPEASDSISRSKTMGNVSTVAFVVAGLAATATVILWLASPNTATP